LTEYGSVDWTPLLRLLAPGAFAERQTTRQKKKASKQALIEAGMH